MLARTLQILMIVTLAACATPPGAPAGLGWRKGVVLRTGDRDAFGPPIDSDCRTQTRPDADPLQRYVEVRYFVGRHAHLRIVPLDDARPVVEGDPIWFRAIGCGPARVDGPV